MPNHPLGRIGLKSEHMTTHPICVHPDLECTSEIPMSVGIRRCSIVKEKRKPYSSGSCLCRRSRLHLQPERAAVSGRANRPVQPQGCRLVRLPRADPSVGHRCAEDGVGLKKPHTGVDSPIGSMQKTYNHLSQQSIKIITYRYNWLCGFRTKSWGGIIEIIVK